MTALRIDAPGNTLGVDDPDTKAESFRSRNMATMFFAPRKQVENILLSDGAFLGSITWFLS